MEPARPVVPGVKLPEAVYAEHQPEYKPLPCYRDPTGWILTRWHMSLRERITALFLGDVYLYVHTFNQPLQPLKLQVERPTFADGGKHETK